MNDFFFYLFYRVLEDLDFGEKGKYKSKVVKLLKFMLMLEEISVEMEKGRYCRKNR